MKHKRSEKTNRIFVRIDTDTALKLTRLGRMGEIPSDVIKKLIDHVHVCDIWWMERDVEDKL